MGKILVEESVLKNWMDLLEHDLSAKTVSIVVEEIYDVLQKTSFENAPKIDNGGLAFSQIVKGKDYMIRPDKTISPAEIQGALVYISEKKRTNVVAVLQHDCGSYKKGTRFNTKPSILQEI